MGKPHQRRCALLLLGTTTTTKRGCFNGLGLRHPTTVLRFGSKQLKVRIESDGHGEQPTKMAARYVNDRSEHIRGFLASKGVDFDRPCTFDSDGDCWLAGTLAPWNKILSVVGLELSEFQPTTLCLRSNDLCSIGEPSVHAPCNGAYLLAWLPEQHTCVQSICLHENIRSYKTPALALKMLLPFSAHLRHLTIKGRYSIPFGERDLCNSMAVLKTLETFECFELRINYCDLERGVATLLHRNRRNLTKVRFQNNKLSPKSTAFFLSALLECEVLSELSFNCNHLNKGNVESLAVIIRCLRNLKKLSLDFSIYSKEPFGPIAEALESNASLEELSLKGCQVEFKLLFEALHTNTTLKMLNLECCTMTFNEVKYFAATLSLNKGLRTVLLPNCQLKDEGITSLAHAMAINNTLQKLDLHDNRGDD
ncbi:hypothetical protein MRX96_006268 [Rhipicephalus microplus]